MRTTAVLLVALLAALLAIACSQSTGPSIALPEGVMRLWYDAPEAGGENSMNATGEFTFRNGRVHGAGFAAAGEHAQATDRLTIVGFTPLAENGTASGRVFAITLPASEGERTIPIVDRCDSAECAATLFIDGVEADDPQGARDPATDRACAITAGTLVITAHTRERVRGVFYGEGYCTRGHGAEVRTRFAVDSATFDVPIDRRYRPRITLP